MFLLSILLVIILHLGWENVLCKSGCSFRKCIELAWSTFIELLKKPEVFFFSLPPPTSSTPPLSAKVVFFFAPLPTSQTSPLMLTKLALKPFPFNSIMLPSITWHVPMSSDSPPESKLHSSSSSESFSSSSLSLDASESLAKSSLLSSYSESESRYSMILCTGNL